ncbi:MAG: DegT/DnrJ/EryC1/StrS family aminotransferase [Oscillospiraceae bacterium]|nr:DegT/DnrJ/EryC1/StrS family aminotransferase [Oscillospiraceae bacterium]
MIEFSPPDITEKEIEEVCGVLRSGWITTGAKTAGFEEKIAAYIGCSRGVCTSSATTALELVLQRLGIGVGDEVIIPAYTYTATAAAVLHTGAVPVIADVGENGYNITAESIADLLTERTAAVIAVDIGGVMCDYSALRKILVQNRVQNAKNNDIMELYGRPILIADGAHSFGSASDGKISGNGADITCFSFHAVKNLTTAEGGCIVWREKENLDSEKLRRELKTMSLHGQTKDAGEKSALGGWEYDILLPGWKCNMTDIQAAIGIAQLERYGEMLQKRKKICQIYDSVFAGRVETLPHSGENFESNRHLYMVNVGGDEARRNGIVQAMAERGVCCNVHFKPLPLLTAYKNLGFSEDACPNAIRRYCGEISLPIHGKMTEEDAQYVAETLLDCLK